MAELVLALDLPDTEQALKMAEKVQKDLNWVKVGLELFCSSGPLIISSLKQMGFAVFLDLKFMDIPNTVYKAVQSAALAGADMLTLHLTGGEDMVRAALKARKEQESVKVKPPLILGVTLLTSFSRENLPWPDTRNLDEIVLDLALKGKKWGLDGAVCSALECAAVKKHCAPNYVCLTPGIRVQTVKDDQKRVMTPEEAVRAGSDFLVVGRPITRDLNPSAAAKKIQARISDAKEYRND